MTTRNKAGISCIMLTAIFAAGCASTKIQTGEIKPDSATCTEIKTVTKLNNMRVIEIPKFRAVSSGYDTFNNIFAEDGFNKWVKTHPQYIKNLLYAPADFLWFEDGKAIWVYAINDDVTAEDVAPYEITECAGGIYLVATADESDKEDFDLTMRDMFKWIHESDVFELDDRPGHRRMAHMVGCEFQKKFGVAQRETFLPLKFRNPN